MLIAMCLSVVSVDDLKFLTDEYESMAFRRRGYERDALLQAVIARAGFKDLDPKLVESLFDLLDGDGSGEIEYLELHAKFRRAYYALSQAKVLPGGATEGKHHGKACQQQGG